MIIHPPIEVSDDPEYCGDCFYKYCGDCHLFPYEYDCDCWTILEKTIVNGLRKYKKCDKCKSISKSTDLILNII